MDKIYRIFIGVWLGTIVFFSFIIAPQIFSYLPHDQAADLQNQLFPSYYIVCSLCGLLCFCLDFFRYRDKIGWIALGIAIAIVGFVALTPLIRNAYLHHDPSMQWLHPTAIALNVVMLITVLIAA